MNHCGDQASMVSGEIPGRGLSKVRDHKTPRAVTWVESWFLSPLLLHETLV